MVNQSKQENFFERSVWGLFLVLGVIEILFGVGDMIARGVRWAWFTFWSIPVSMAFIAVLQYIIRQPGESLAPPFYSGSLFAVLTTLWLALSYRKYFSSGEGG